MSTIVYKQATRSHLPQLHKIAPLFVKHYGMLSVNASMYSRIDWLVDNGVCFVCEVNNEVVGCILGAYVPNFWSGEEMLTEFAWWVDDNYRKFGVGSGLLNKFEHCANGRKIVLSILPQSGIKPEHLNKMGYSLQEYSFVKE